MGALNSTTVIMLNEGLEVGEDEEISDNSTTGSSSNEKEATEAGQDDGNGCEDNKSTDQNEQKNSGAAQKGSNFTKSFIFERSNVMPLANYLELWHAELVEMSPRYSCNKITTT